MNILGDALSMNAGTGEEYVGLVLQIEIAS